jgi:hypothetical protein
MDLHRYSALGLRRRGRVPSQRDGRSLEHAARTVEDWLATQDLEQPGIVDDADSLRQVGVLARAGAPDTELNRAVRFARQQGWGWAPIALLLGESRDQARRRLA